jgi:glycerate 2-kinase
MDKLSGGISSMTGLWKSILNREQLTDHGEKSLRADAVDIIETGLRAADPYTATLNLVSLAGNILKIGHLIYDLSRWENIFVIGAGKATQPVALALEEVLGDKITDGCVALKNGEVHQLKRIKIVDAAHPVPDENSFLAAQRMVEIARRAGPKDIVIAAITGGSSSLLVWPLEGISLEDKRHVNQVLLDSGASIREINAVRKHISKVKGGRLALEIFPAELVNLTVSDVVGDPLDYITDLTVPDTSTWEDAWKTMERYHLWGRFPGTVVKALRSKTGGETPKEFLSNHHSFIVTPGDALCQGVAQRCRELGYVTMIMTLELEGEACQSAQDFAFQAQKFANPGAAGEKYALIAGGETTVTLTGMFGEGGPNQEFALCAAGAIAGKNGMVIAAIDADGTDGPTIAAGGLVDGDTSQRAARQGLDHEAAKRNHASKEYLEAAGDLVISGPTGTNVNDLMLALISESSIDRGDG